MPRELRKDIRRMVRQGARMVSSDSSALGPCLIVDISVAGARLEVKTSDALPYRFILLLSHNGRLQRRCSVAWRSGTAVGVRFIH